MPNLWNKETENTFFVESLKFATPEQLFYTSSANQYFAYWPKGYQGTKTTLQSRNSLIGTFTERWTQRLFQDIVKPMGLFAVQGLVCPEIALTRNSPGDVAICKNSSIYQKPENILLIIEVKMSVVWNWELEKINGEVKLKCIGDYKKHQGNPGMLRSDSMLKAIGKSINIRVSSLKASDIPILIMGNTPITDSYNLKVDHLKLSGIVQGFWSLNPQPLDDNGENIKETDKKGFFRFDTFNELTESFNSLLLEERNFFSSMKSKKELGEFIEIANKEKTYERKAEVFLKLLRM
jgi:hypothetical protein